MCHAFDLSYNPSPTINGKFAVKSDVCIYAWGCVLYQRQRNKNNQWLWRIIDMLSQIMPKQMHQNHCKLHEWYGFAKLIQHLLVRFLEFGKCTGLVSCIS